MKTINMAVLTLIGSTTTLFAATGTAAATVLPPRPLEYLNERAAALESQKGQYIRFDCNNFDRRYVRHHQGVIVTLIKRRRSGQHPEGKPHNNQPQRQQIIAT
jgi:hypothetical protein